MVKDYKGVSFSFNNIKKAKRQKRFRLIVLGITIILLFYTVKYFMDGASVTGVQDFILIGQQAKAEEKFRGIEDDMFHGKNKKELKALFHLLKGEYDEGKAVLETMDGEPSGIDYEKFLAFFAERAMYRGLGIYCEYFLRDGSSDRVEDLDIGERILFYRGLYKAAAFDHTGSTKALDRLSPDFRVKESKALEMIERFNKESAAGKVQYIFDTNGLPLAYYNIKTKKTVSLTPGFSFAAFTPGFEADTRFYRLTLDLGLQQKLDQLFRRYTGSFILLNLEDCSIAAAYSKPYDPVKAPVNPVFSRTYEPGSIIKLLTVFTYWRSGQTKLFPFKCKGSETIDGKIFYDWLKHDEVVSEEDALAVSCNLAVAHMGLDVGYKALSATFDKFYFNSGVFTDGPLVFRTGNYKKNISGSYRLANMAEGLNEVTITTFHAGILSAVIAQNGSIYSPYLIKNQKNLMNLGFYNHEKKLLKVMEDNTNFSKLKTAMVYVVEAPEGTGRRARVEEVKIALKTGTAGNKKVGLDAILTGFFPADKPRYAFAFRLERGGKAEYNGALFLKRFLAAFVDKK